MTLARRSRALVGGFLAATLVAVLIPLGGAAPASADEYPSWDEVQAAKADAASAQAEADRIAFLLGGLEAEAARLGDDAVAQAAAAESANRAAESAAAELADLDARADEAKTAAEAATRQAGAVAASMSRAGDPVMELWLSGGAADSMLSRIGTMSRLTGSLSLLRDRADRQRNEAASLIQQARAASAERDRLAAEARERAEAASAAQQSADAQLADAQARSATLYEQLAALKNSSADLERGYREAQQQAASYSSGGGSSGAGGSTGEPSGGSEGAGDDSAGSGDELAAISSGPGSMSPADARAYAAGRVSARGWGDSEYQCLVRLWTRESSWRWNAYNASSGAYGIPQSLPGSKMASVGADWRTSAATQIDWGLGYITSRYGSPCGAWAHSQDVGWY